jgi:hypothetical protein
MATYYVSTSTGNNGNNGTSPLTPWATLTYALGGTTAVTSGDTIYVAPGVYRQNIVIGITNPTANTKIIGSTDGSIFTNVPVGYVRITSAISDNGSFSGQTLTGTTKNYIWLENLLFEGSVQLLTSANMTFTNCSFYGPVYITSPSGLATNATINKCIFVYTGIPVGNGLALYIQGTGTATTGGNVIQSCIFHNYYSPAIGAVLLGDSTGNLIYNCSFFGAAGRAIWSTVANNVQVYNSLFCGYYSTAALGAGASGQITSNYNRFVVSGTVANNVTVGVNSIISTASIGVDFGSAYQFALPPLQPMGSFASSPNAGVGTATGALAYDTFGKTWSGASPDAGGVTYAPIGTTSFYFPSERNASTITIAPGSASQSIELYLGATGLTASTAGLSARYNRTRTASVSIPLVARTIAQAWTAGGFAEVDATNMPGVYRLDLPDAALAAGADDVTIVVRGASGTNGAVMTVKLSSGGLTSAQTASAVLDALTDDHQIHGTFGYNLLRADAPSKEGLVTLHQSGGISRVDADVHAIANDTDAATELKGALLHNGTDYISADLLTPVSAATSVHIGPYQLLADGLGADQPLDVNVGTATSIDVQVTDANGTGIDITGATVSAKVYNSGGTLVATYNGTATYADNGRLSFGLTTTVTNTSGTYTVTVTRTTGASDTQVFGPLKLYVRPV